jgi:hypothetical protein
MGLRKPAKTRQFSLREYTRPDALPRDLQQTVLKRLKRHGKPYNYIGLYFPEK